MTRPADMDGEPWEVAAKALEQTAAALAKVVEQFEQTTTQLRNARMQDALELSPAELHAQYAEAVDDEGYLIGDGTFPAKIPADDPYDFWEATYDAALAERAQARLDGALADVAALVERQPEVGRNTVRSGT